MKKLILVRHAKSSWDNLDLVDFERHLSEKGIKEIKFMSKILKKFDLKTDLILCSSSFRTRETLEGLWEEFNAKNENIVYDRGIYDYHNSETLDYYLSLLSKIDDKKEVVVLFGHNPFITKLIRFLSGNDNLVMGTLGIGVIDFDIEKWDEVLSKKGFLNFFLNPNK